MEPLRRADFLLLAGLTALLFSVSLAAPRVLGNHETIHCQNVREMLADGDYIIPHCGGRPWLERPPLPFWLTLPFVRAFGDTALTYRLVSLLVALWAVLLTGWMASLWHGRAVGILSACIFMTIQEVHRYAIAPESDIFVCALVATGMALFAHLEFRLRPDSRVGFLGPRPWALLAFFVVLGLGNLVKGLYFADLHLLAPTVLFILWRPGWWEALRRYLWLPGWLAFLAAGSAWALAAYARHPDIVALWGSDYNGRLTQGYMNEPWWYYLANLPVVLLPWAPLALLGLWLTRHKALGKPASPERFLWCWALAPLILLSIPRGKHHHYLLSALAPWAVLAAAGAARAWEWLRQLPSAGLAVSLAVLVAVADVAFLVAWGRYPGLQSWSVFALVAPPLLASAAWLSARQTDAGRGVAALVAAVFLLFWVKEHPEWAQQDGRRADLAFLHESAARAGDGPLLVLDNFGPLDASWSLYHLGSKARLLHNASFLRDDTLPEGEVFVLSRPVQIEEARAIARVEEVASSPSRRSDRYPAHRLTLYRVRLHPHVARLSAKVYISPMQATGREDGPQLRPDPASRGRRPSE
jgi:4-amino-4-deoxy-L-arabinose transferase-like glycosyltransferase